MENTVEFYKYQGTGNDFVMIDNRDGQFPKVQSVIKHLCDRRFGIGGDGLILLENAESKVPAAESNNLHQSYSDIDFKMVYYNSDGSESSMCGNGGRCIVAFANFLDIIEDTTLFEATDGLHEAEISNGNVKLKMIDVHSIQMLDQNFELNTGSPHFVQFVHDLKNYEVYQFGNKIRNSATYQHNGINVNFVEKLADDEIFVRTYERGVEDETYSCGTGATASALVYMKEKDINAVHVKVMGGNLTVYAQKNGNGFEDIWLEGPAKQSFRGKVKI